MDTTDHLCKIYIFKNVQKNRFKFVIVLVFSVNMNKI